MDLHRLVRWRASPSDVLWLVDGIRINNRLYGGTTPLDTLPASMVERIEVLNGGQALFYGTQASAGAVFAARRVPALLTAAFTYGTTTLAWCSGC